MRFLLFLLPLLQRLFAIERSKTHNCPVILGSATPSIESYARAKKGYYKYLELDKRVNERPLPKVEIIDMKKEIIIWVPTKISYFPSLKSSIILK